MTLYDLKPAFQGLLRPMVGRMAGVGITANQVTLGAAAGSVALGAATGLAALQGVLWPFALLPVWLFARMALNAVDGMLAREHGQKSVLGGYLNEITDIVSDAAMILPFALIVPPASVIACALLAGLTETAGVLGWAAGAGRRYDGPLGKSDRALVFGALGLWAGLAGGLPPLVAVVFWMLAGLMALTVVNRVRAGLAHAAGEGRA